MQSYYKVCLSSYTCKQAGSPILVIELELKHELKLKSIALRVPVIKETFVIYSRDELLLVLRELGCTKLCPSLANFSVVF